MAKIGLLLVNLGTPSAPTPDAVGTYLKEFLNDPKVITLPWPLRQILVNFLIVPKRKFSSSENYKKIWTERGSPLAFHLQDLEAKLRYELRRFDFSIKSAMRYGAPSLRERLIEWLTDPPEHILVLPLYPQYAYATTQSTIEAVTKIVKDIKLKSNLRFLEPFYDKQEFLDSFKEIAISQCRSDSFVLFSFHGLPVSQVCRPITSTCCDRISIENKDCYRAQCVQTAKGLAHSLNLDPQRWKISFQSRLGAGEWIRPYTDQTVVELAKNGVKDLVVICPSFVSDCLETIEEIGMQIRRDFITAGGEKFTLVSSLNSEPHWVKNLGKLIVKELN